MQVGAREPLRITRRLGGRNTWLKLGGHLMGTFVTRGPASRELEVHGRSLKAVGP
jgi:hypothetical protein